jgi:hypothetical protein
MPKILPFILKFEPLKVISAQPKAPASYLYVPERLPPPPSLSSPPQAAIENPITAANAITPTSGARRALKKHFIKELLFALPVRFEAGNHEDLGFCRRQMPTPL